MAENDTLEAFCRDPILLPLEGVVRHYDWGGYEFIPHLLGLENAEHQPFAELWMGAHPSAPSMARLNGETAPLDRIQKAAPGALLGARSATRFHNQLPYLFKVLDARKMLSIQAHPTKRQAEEGFQRENERGVDLDDPNRNYKDANHKPEVHVALSEFWMLHGFRPLAEIAWLTDAANPNAARELAPLTAGLPNATGRDESAALRALYERVMTMPQNEVDIVLRRALDRIARRDAPSKNSPDYWAARAAREFPLPDGHLDRGIFSIYLLNLVHLQPGQGTYQPAGCLHAYLEGVNMELMANSDNVLRGGLTPKHVDVPELMRILDFQTGKPDILTGIPVSETETVYPTPASEFLISRIALGPGEHHLRATGHGPDTLITLEGSARITSSEHGVDLPRGCIAMAPDAVEYAVESEAGAIVYRASVPVH